MMGWVGGWCFLTLNQDIQDFFEGDLAGRSSGVRRLEVVEELDERWSEDGERIGGMMWRELLASAWSECFERNMEAKRRMYEEEKADYFYIQPIFITYFLHSSTQFLNYFANIYPTSSLRSPRPCLLSRF